MLWRSSPESFPCRRRKADNPPAGSLKCGFVFAPDGTQILDSYRIEISYDPKALEFSSGKILSDRFNGSFEMIEDDGLLSVIYLAEESDVMREETDMALLRFRTRERIFPEPRP